MDGAKYIAILEETLLQSAGDVRLESTKAHCQIYIGVVPNQVFECVTTNQSKP